MAGKADPTAKKQRGKPFAKGKSGNPQGRPQGARNKATLLVEQLFENEAEALGRRAIELAKLGHPMMLKLALDRLAPPRRDRPVLFRLPKLETAADAAKASAALVEAVAAGDLTPSEAAELGKLVETYLRALGATDFEARLAALEQHGAKT